MTLRHLPAKCDHGHPIHKHFKSLDDGLLNFYIPECRDAHKNLKSHRIDPTWPEDTARYGTYELERGAGRRSRNS